MLTREPPHERLSVTPSPVASQSRGTERRRGYALVYVAPYAVAVASTIFFFRRTLLAGLLPGDNGDARWTIAIYEHWYKVWQGDESLRDVSFFFPTSQTLGMSDAYVLHGQVHSLARVLGLDPVSAWAVATIGIYLAGALGLAFLSTLTLRSGFFRCAFVALVCLSYPINVMMHHPQLVASLVLSWVFAGGILLFHQRGGKVGVYLTITITPLLVLTSWYAALLGVLTLLTLAGFLALLTPSPLLKHSLVQFAGSVRASLSTWYGWLVWVSSLALWALALWIYLPARGISPHSSPAELAFYSPRLSDLVNASSGGGGVWAALYDPVFDASETYEERELGFTPLLLLALLVAGGAALRRLAVASTAAASKPMRSQLRTANICVAGVLTVLSLAIITVVDERGFSVFRWLWEFVPGFDTIRAPFRIQLVLYGVATFVVVAALEAWTRRRRLDRARHDIAPRKTGLAGRWIFASLLMLGILIEMQRAPKHWSAAELVPPGLATQIPTVRDSCNAFVLQAGLRSGEAGAALAAVDAVMLSMLAEVPTANGWSRAAPIGHPGMSADPAALIGWMRTRRYQGDVCVVSPEGVEVVRGTD